MIDNIHGLTAFHVLHNTNSQHYSICCKSLLILDQNEYEINLHKTKHIYSSENRVTGVTDPKYDLIKFQLESPIEIEQNSFINIGKKFQCNSQKIQLFGFPCKTFNKKDIRLDGLQGYAALDKNKFSYRLPSQGMSGGPILIYDQIEKQYKLVGIQGQYRMKEQDQAPLCQATLITQQIKSQLNSDNVNISELQFNQQLECTQIDIGNNQQ